jgi:HEAT repeat protein
VGRLKRFGGLFALAATLAVSACSGGSKDTPASAPASASPASGAASDAAPRMSPTAESVWAVCEGTVPRGAEDRRLVAERMGVLADQKSDEARRVLLHCLNSDAAPTEARTEAARILIEHSAERDLVIAGLRKLLRNREPDVRLWHKTILAQLFTLRAKEALPEIADAILITEEEAKSLGLADVVDAAVRALVDFDTPESWAGLERAAQDSRAAVRRPVVQALAALFNRPKARARLLKFLDDPSPDVRTRACTLLLYEPLSRRDRRPDLFKSNPCFATPAAWPNVAVRVREAIDTYDAYARAHPPPTPPGVRQGPPSAPPSR